jgi:hypothetical protein
MRMAGISLLLMFTLYGLIPRSLGDGLSPPLPVQGPRIEPARIDSPQDTTQCVGRRCN